MNRVVMGMRLKDVIIIRFSLLIINTTYSVSIPFLPNMAEEHRLHNWHIGLILSAYAVGGLFKDFYYFSQLISISIGLINLLIMGKFMRYMNKKVLLNLLWLIATLATVGIAYIDKIEDRELFFILVFLCRFF